MASTLKVDTIAHTGGTSAMTINSSGKTHIAGSVVNVWQFTAAEQSIISDTVIINQAFTPSFANSKFNVSLVIPNMTGSAGGRIIARIYLGTDATYSNNTKVAEGMQRLMGTGADDVQGMGVIDFGSYTNPNTNAHRAQVVCFHSTNTTIGRHSGVIKLVVQEIAQ